jgi:Arc/MetJ family transcription regulator
MKMTKRLVNIDDRALRAAQRKLQTKTITDTVNQALRDAAGSDADDVKKALDTLDTAFPSREDAWR